MYQRLLSWVFFCAFGAVAVLRAQAPAAAAGTPQPGTIQVAHVTGTVTKTVNGQVTPLKMSDFVEPTAKVITARDSSIVLAFSNGATTQLGDDTELVIEEFLQAPFEAAFKVADLEEEPSRSNTKLHLSKGELVGKVAKLKHASGSTFIVQTPVGAAGIRGTTFRIVFRPRGTGLAFFQLSTVEGNVNFNQSGSGATTPPVPGGGAQPGQTQVPDPTTAQPAQTPGGGGQGSTQPQAAAPVPGAPAAGVPVVTGQEVVIAQVTVNVTPAGQVVVTAPPQIVTNTRPISAAAQAQIVAQAQNIAVAVATTTFTPTPPPAPQSAAPAAGGTPNRAAESTEGGSTSQSAPQSGAGGTGGNTGNTTPGGTTPAAPGSPSTKGASGTAGASGTTPANPVATRPPTASNPPAVIPPSTRTTPLDGRGPGG